MNAIAPGRSRAHALVGIGLVIVGLTAIGVRNSGISVLDGASWPWAVIVPGLVLLVIATVLSYPTGLVSAIAGSIITTVGVLLLYQQSTDHWESWAYVWALIPAAAGLAILAYGLLFRRRRLVGLGARIAAVAGLLFVALMWIVETVFRTGSAPIAIETWGPAIVIVLGVLIVANSLRRRPSTARPPGDESLSPAPADRG